LSSLPDVNIENTFLTEEAETLAQHIYAFNSVNLKLGYHMLEIRSPGEVIYEEEI
jgi:hypothetical protein